MAAQPPDRALESALHGPLTRQLAAGRVPVAVLGATAVGLEMCARVRALVGDDALAGLFDPTVPEGEGKVRPWSSLRDSQAALVVIASDADKERLLSAAADVFDDARELPTVILAGLAHQDFRDALFEQLERPALVPSYATGHPASRVHMFQLLQHAARHGLTGAIVELGAFKGGTTAWLARTIAALGIEHSRVIGFDSWTGFPPRRSLLDLYEHPRCVFDDLAAARAYTAPFGVELVPGDIAETVPEFLAAEPVLLAFVDTDNYSGTRIALEAILPNVVVGGAIVLDHYWTLSKYVYTVGERMAAREVLTDSGMLPLHGTGVFVRVI
jgi:O-methyltransferase